MTRTIDWRKRNDDQEHRSACWVSPRGVQGANRQRYPRPGAGSLPPASSDVPSDSSGGPRRPCKVRPGPGGLREIDLETNFEGFQRWLKDLRRTRKDKLAKEWMSPDGLAASRRGTRLAEDLLRGIWESRAGAWPAAGRHDNGPEIHLYAPDVPPFRLIVATTWRSALQDGRRESFVRQAKTAKPEDWETPRSTIMRSSIAMAP